MEQVHLLRAAHDDVADLGHDVDGDALLHALLQDQIPVVAADAAEEHGLHPLQDGKIALQTLLQRSGPADLEFLAQAVGADQLPHVPAPVMDDRRAFGGEYGEIPLVGADGPEDRDHKLDCKEAENRQHGDQPPLHQAQDQIQNAVGHQ